MNNTNNIIKEIKQAIDYGKWVKERKITKEENDLLIKQLLNKQTNDCQP